MTIPTNGPPPLAIKDCALASIATGVRVQNLRELRDQVATIHPGCLFNHFWGSLLAPRFEVREFHNDFAAWAAEGLHDPVLAERLAMIDPANHAEIEGLRRELLHALEDRLDEREHVPWARLDCQFHFVRAQVVVFDAHRSVAAPEELATVVPRLSLGSVFYHVVDARRRSPQGRDDFREWLSGHGDGYPDVVAAVGHVDPYFLTLSELRQRLASIFEDHFGAHGHAPAPR